MIKKKQFTAIILSLFMMIMGSVPVSALEYGDEWTDYTNSVQQHFSDVSLEYWAAENINRTVSKGWFEGYPDGTFHPDASISRAEAMTVFVKFLGLQLKNVHESSYYDVKTTDWYSPYIEAGKALFPVIPAFNGETPFRPEMPITREDTIYALVTALRYSDDTVNADQSVLNMFSDKNSISEAVKPYVTVAVKKELVAGYPDGTIGAQDPLTRAEFATLLYRASFVGFGNSEINLAENDNNAIDRTELNSAPVFDSIDYPSTVSSRTAKIKGRVSDASGEALTLDIDGRAVQIRNGAFESTVDVEIGTNTYLLTLTNATGKNTQRIVKIKRENDSSQDNSSSGGSASQSQNNSSSGGSGSQSQGGNTNTAQRPTVVKYEWSVNNIELEVGETGRIKLMEVYSDGSRKDVTNSFTLSSSNTSVATVSRGTVTGISAGTAKISFESGGIGASISIPRPLNVTVKAQTTASPSENAAVIVGYEWSVDSIEIEIGETAAVKLIEVYSDETRKDVTDSFVLSSNNTDVATVSGGIVTGAGAGTAKITFSSGGVGATVSIPRPLTVTVKAAEAQARLIGLEWSESEVTVSVGRTATLRLYGVYSDGTKRDLTDECGVYADDEDIAVINGTTVRGIEKGATEVWFSSVPGANLRMPGVVSITVTD